MRSSGGCTRTRDGSTRPRPLPVPHGYHRFSLVHEDFAEAGFEDERYAALRANPPEGCELVDWGCFALECERPDQTRLDAVTSTVAEIRREHGLVRNGMRIEKTQEWLGDDKNLVRLLDTMGVE